MTIFSCRIKTVSCRRRLLATSVGSVKSSSRRRSECHGETRRGDASQSGRDPCPKREGYPRRGAARCDRPTSPATARNSDRGARRARRAPAPCAGGTAGPVTSSRRIKDGDGSRVRSCEARSERQEPSRASLRSRVRLSSQRRSKKRASRQLPRHARPGTSEATARFPDGRMKSWPDATAVRRRAGALSCRRSIQTVKVPPQLRGGVGESHGRRGGA